MMLKSKNFFISWCLSLFLVFAFAAGAQAYSSLLAFGDSLSDNGYYQGYSGGTAGNTNPYDIYGFKRYSNGTVWVEYLAQDYSLSLLDMAYGGATSSWNNPAAYNLTGNSDYLTTTGLQWQIDKYQKTYGSISSNTLISVWAGGNDMLNYNPSVDPIKYNPYTAAQNVATAIANLYALGGRNFIVMNLSWNAITDPDLLAGAQGWMTLFNQTLAAYLAALEATPGMNIYDIDLTKLYYENLNLNGTYTTPGNETGPFANWDKVHPTTEAHRQIANYVEAQVPEPASILLLIIGFAGLVGARRKIK